MLTSLGAAILLGVLGTIAAVAWAMVVRWAGAPAAWLAASSERRGRLRWVAPFTSLGLAVEIYLLLGFGGAVVLTVRRILVEWPEMPAWPLWLAGWYLAAAPVLFAGKAAGSVAVRDAQDTATNVALPASGLVYWLFVAWPILIRLGWPWLAPLD